MKSPNVSTTNKLPLTVGLIIVYSLETYNPNSQLYIAISLLYLNDFIAVENIFAYFPVVFISFIVIFGFRKVTKTVNSEIIKQEGKIASLEQEQKDVEKDISDEKNKVNKGMTSYLKDLSKGVDYLDSFDWDSLDKSSDTLFQGFSDGALNATSTIDNVDKKYKDAAMNMASNFQAMTGQIGNSLDGLNDNVKNSLTKIGEETLNQIGLTSGATTEQIANAMLSSNSNFNAVVGAMNKSAQEALSEVLKGAGGMLEALGSAIESFSGEIKISIGGIKFRGCTIWCSTANF